MLFLILIPEGNVPFTICLARADFTHTRLSLLVLLPLCTLFSIYLAELKTLPIFARIRQRASPNSTSCALVVIFSAALRMQSTARFLSWLLPYNVIKLFFFSANALLPSAVAQVALTGRASRRVSNLGRHEKLYKTRTRPQWPVLRSRQFVIG